jgi:hypothetical protein
MPWRFQGAHLYSEHSTFNRGLGRTVPRGIRYFISPQVAARRMVAGQAMPPLHCPKWSALRRRPSPAAARLD